MLRPVRIELETSDIPVWWSSYWANSAFSCENEIFKILFIFMLLITSFCCNFSLYSVTSVTTHKTSSTTDKSQVK